MEPVIRSLPQAYRIIKEMYLFGDEESDYRGSARDSLSKILEDRMSEHHQDTIGSGADSMLM